MIDTEGIDREGNSNDHLDNSMNTDDPEDVSREGGSSQKVWIFLIANLVIELLSAAFDQLSSKHKPKYALVGMLMAFVALLGCIAEIAFIKERVSGRWNRRFCTFAEIYGLVCAILQSISATIAYVFYSHHADNPIKVSFCYHADNPT
ncbi:hypothetical protein REPUB_Repub04eG0024200 [Reevesia pubescens]